MTGLRLHVRSLYPPPPPHLLLSFIVSDLVGSAEEEWALGKHSCPLVACRPAQAVQAVQSGENQHKT